MPKVPMSLPRRIRAVIFDLDDTLVESTVDFAKFKRLVIQRIGTYGDDSSRYSPNETIVKIIARFEDRMRDRGVEENRIRTMLAELDRIMDGVELERVSETAAIDGAVELLGYLRKKGIRIGILTRGCEEYALTALSITGMRTLVDEVECRNSNTKAKPDPDSYLNLVRELGVPKDETIFVGDHPIDAQCAANAEVAFIAVLTGDVPEEDLRDAGSAEVFPDVKQMVGWFERLLGN
jgi:HAD superfamily hydrolase (TIGR01549 family)